MPVNFTIYKRNASGSDRLPRRPRDLRRNPSTRPCRPRVYRASSSLHRGVREEGRRVDRIKLRRRFPIAFSASPFCRSPFMAGCVEAFLGISAIVALDCEPFVPSSQTNSGALRCLFGVPPGIGDDRNGGVLHPHNFFTPGMPSILALVVTREFTAKYRTVLDLPR